LSKRPVEADQYFDRVSDAYRAVGDERGLARVAFLRGQVLLRTGQIESAIDVLEGALERYRELDDIPYLSMTAGALGNANLLLGDRHAATHWFIDGVFRIAHEMGDEVALTLILPVVATAAIERGQPEVGATIMGAHEVLSRSYGVRPPVALQLVFEDLDALQRARALVERADFETALERGRQMRLEEVVNLIAGLRDEPPSDTEA
jgi:ATP/maltotriose-dependent transcriptional regulator MalT